MGLVAAKCTNCGAAIEVDNNKEAGTCFHCGTAFITEKVINNYNSFITQNITKHVYGSAGKDTDELIADGIKLYSLGQHKKAREAFQKAIDVNPANWRAWFEYARSAEMGDGIDEYEISNAFNSAYELAKEDPESWKIWFAYAKNCIDIGDKIDNDAVENAFESAYELAKGDPESWKAWFDYAKTRISQKKYAFLRKILVNVCMLTDPLEREKNDVGIYITGLIKDINISIRIDKETFNTDYLLNYLSPIHACALICSLDIKPLVKAAVKACIHIVNYEYGDSSVNMFAEAQNPKVVLANENRDKIKRLAKFCVTTFIESEADDLIFINELLVFCIQYMEFLILKIQNNRVLYRELFYETGFSQKLSAAKKAQKAKEKTDKKEAKRKIKEEKKAAKRK